MTYRVEIKGRQGCLVYTTWEPAGREARHEKDVFDTVDAAVAFARDSVAPNCDYEVRVVDGDGRTHYARRQQPSPSLAGHGAPPGYVRER